MDATSASLLHLSLLEAARSSQSYRALCGVMAATIHAPGFSPTRPLYLTNKDTGQVHIASSSIKDREWLGESYTTGHAAFLSTSSTVLVKSKIVEAVIAMSRDLPPGILHMERIPIPRAVYVLETPYPYDDWDSVDGVQGTIPIRVLAPVPSKVYVHTKQTFPGPGDVLNWSSSDGNGPPPEAMTDMIEKEGVNIHAWSNEHEYMALAKKSYGAVPMVPIEAMAWAENTPYTMREPGLVAVPGTAEVHVHQLRSFLLSLWQFMSDKIVTVSSSRPVSHSMRRWAKVAPEYGSIKVVHLRETETLDFDKAKRSLVKMQIEWSHQWRVRGHERHLRNGNVIWIESYIKGPADKPFIEKDTIYQVDR